MPTLRALRLLFGFALALISTAPATVSAQEVESLVPVLVAPSSHFVSGPNSFFDVNGIAVFRDGTNGAILYKSDGTENGTIQLPLPDDYDSVDLSSSIVADGLLYFLANADNGPWDVWVTDGTSEGTVLFYDNSDDVVGSPNTDLFAVATGVAFRDFKDGGNRLVILPENEEPIIVSGMNPGPGARQFTVLNDQIFASVNVDASTKKFVVLDSGGNEVASFSFDSEGAGNTSISDITAAEDRVYFSVNIGSDGELHVYHAGEISKIFDVEDEFMRRPRNMTAIGSRIYFYAERWEEDGEYYSGATQNWLATSAGTRGSTQFVWNDDSSWSNAGNAVHVVAGDALAFAGPFLHDPGRSWHVTNPAPAGTELISIDGNVFYQSGSRSFPEWVAVEDGAWIISMNNMFFTDGTSAGSVQVIDGELTLGSQSQIGAVGGLPWFMATITGTSQAGLYRLGSISTAVDGEPAIPEVAVRLEQSHPNPTVDRATIPFEIADRGRVIIELFDLLGRRVMLLHDGVMVAGRHDVTLDATELAPGTYVYRIRMGEHQQARRLTVQ